MISIKDFCDCHEACHEGRDWALANCQTMDDVWRMAKPSWVIWVATRPKVLEPTDRVRFASWCVRQVWHLLGDERSRHAIEAAERWCDGLATDDELRAYAAAACAAADAAYAAAYTSQAQWLRTNTKPNWKTP